MRAMTEYRTLVEPEVEPLQMVLNTIFECAEKIGVHEVVFQPERVPEPTEVEGVPMPVVPAGSIVLFVYYRIAEEDKCQVRFGSDIIDALMDHLRNYTRRAWQVEMNQTDLGRKAVVLYS
jgi:hypothetical protein